MKNNWSIQYQGFDGRWKPMSGFAYLGKSCAAGAWAMLRAHYNHKNKHRLMQGNVVVEEMGQQTVELS